MKKIFAALSLSLFSVTALANQIVPTFSNGSTVKCVASHNIGNDGTGYSEQVMDVFYRIDDGQTEVEAYFKQEAKLGDYTYQGFCSSEFCELYIRDVRTNTISDMNAAYVKVNNNTAQIQITNVKENLTLTMKCQLIPPAR